MVSMDREEKRKWQKVGVIVAEAMMVLTVITIVTFATLLAMGYNLTKDGTVEQTGLLQLHTMPTGATVEIDGEEQFARSNMSKNLSPGAHGLKVSKAKYDTWEKEVQIIPGRVNRLYYPRLFLNERKQETMTEFKGELAFYSTATNRKAALWAYAGDPVWQVVNLNNQDFTVHNVDGTAFWNTQNPLGEILSLTWSGDSNAVLLQTKIGEESYWYLINLQDMSKSLNLTRTFGLNFERVVPITGSADRLFALENGNLREINVTNQGLSRILLSQVTEFDNVGSLVAYARKVETGYEVGTYRGGEQDGVVITTVETTLPVHVAANNYYDDDYLTMTTGAKMISYMGKYPNYREDRVVAAESLSVAAEVSLEMTPVSLSHSRGGEYVLARAEQNLAVLDLEQLMSWEYAAPSAAAAWFDDSMFYAVTEGELVVFDFDGTNKRNLAKQVTNWDVTITENNKYLYYLSGNKLVREQVVE